MFTTFNGNGQAIEQIRFDGVSTFTDYDPMTGLPLASWTDNAGTGVYAAGVDSMQVSHESPPTTVAGAAGGDTDDDESTSGDQTDGSSEWNGGLDSSDTEDGMTTTDVQSLPTGPGDYTDTTTNPDGTKSVSTYVNDLLTQVQDIGTNNSVTDTTTDSYNDMGELISQADSTGTTLYSYYADGTLKSTTDPAGNVTTNNNPEGNANQQETTTLPNGLPAQQTFNTEGNLVSQSGAGILSATFGYDSATDQLNSMTDGDGHTTQWGYDLNTGQLQSETFADNTQDTFEYNNDGQLAKEVEPGMTGTLSYDPAGNLTDAQYTDTDAGLTESKVLSLDDQQRPLVTQSTDNGETFNETDAYTATGDLGSETYGAANASLNYGYYSTTSSTPDALQSLTVQTPSQSIAETDSYNTTTKRLQTIDVNGTDITYTYDAGSNQIQSITIGDVTTNYTQQSNSKALLSAMTVTAGGSEVYSGTYDYNDLDERYWDLVYPTIVNNDGSLTQMEQKDIEGYSYSPSNADALTGAGTTTIDLDTDQCSTTTSSYSYDDAGNFTNNPAMGTANDVDEYSNFTYNSRHDLTDDGTYSYGYDALNRLISVTPDNPTDSSVAAQYGYDSQGRMAWEQDENWGIGPSCAPAWIPGNSYTFVWAGNELEAKLDGSGNVLQKYTWAPDENGQPKIQEFTDFSSGSAVNYALTYDASGDVDDEFVASTGQEVASFSFAPFGALVSATGPGVSICPVGFKGYQTNFAVDPNLAMAQPAPGYTIGRDINTAYGIFQQPDPSGLSGGINSVAVDGNDPIDYSDPDGLSPLDINRPVSPDDLSFVVVPDGPQFDINTPPTPNVIQAPSNEELYEGSWQPPAGFVGSSGRPTQIGAQNSVTLDDILRELPSTYWETLKDGEQNDSINGCWDALTNAISGGHGSHYGTEYGHQDAYDNAHTVGEAAGFTINAVLLVSGIGGTIKSVQTVATSLGTLNVAIVALNDGRMIPVIMQNGHAVIATAETLANAGVAAGTANNIIQMKIGGQAPPENGGSTTYQHGGPEHDAAINEYIDKRIPKGAEDIRKNQMQVDVNGEVVGNNRPDIQYNLDGKHYVVEIDNDPNASSAHAVQIQANDPNADVTQIGLGKPK